MAEGGKAERGDGEMDPVLAGAIGFGVFFFIVATGLPVGVALTAVGFAGLVYLLSWGPAMAVFAYTPFSVVSNYDFSVIPLFLLMAYVIHQAGLSTDLYNLAAKLIGHQRGGLAMATVGGCAGFAAMCADSLATTVSMGLVSLPEMKRFNYQPSLAVGAICAGGTIGILIPPSNLLIIYGILTETSIGKLFMAGIIPGILEAVFYIVTIYILCRLNPALGPPGASYSLREKIVAIGGCGEMIALILLVLGGLIIGWFTPTEAGAVGAFGAIAFSLIRRRLNWEKFKQALFETMRTTGLLYVIVIGAFVFMPFVALSTIPRMLADYVATLAVPPIVIVMLVALVYIILGCFMESLAMILITIPIFLPLCLSLGYSPIWFGIIIVRVVEIGLITPPLGLNAYTMAQISGVPVHTVFKGVFPFIIADILHVALLLFVPSLSLFLPSIM
jgi:C4-dicarboxylate transporter DctM subunit